MKKNPRGKLMRSALEATANDGAVARVESFLGGVARLSSNVPHLTSGLGSGQFHRVSVQANDFQAALRLRGDYGINSWENQVVAMNKTPQGEASTAISGEPKRFSPTTAAPDQ